MPRNLAEAVDRLHAQGYRADFRAEEGGLRELSSRRLYEPESLVVEELLRFEGDSDPEAQAAVFALRARDGSARGTWTVSYGPGMDPLDGEMARRLADARQ